MKLCSNSVTQKQRRSIISYYIQKKLVFLMISSLGQFSKRKGETKKCRVYQTIENQESRNWIEVTRETTCKRN